MSNNTKISWTSISWNIMTGCTPISDGCNDCYAKAMVKRLQAMGQAKYQNGFTPTIHPECMNEPFWWKGNKLVFVASMGDFFSLSICPWVKICRNSVQSKAFRSFHLHYT